MNKTFALIFSLIMVTALAVAPCCMAMQNLFGGTYLGTYSGENSGEFSALPSITFSPSNGSSWSSYYVGDETVGSFVNTQGNSSSASPSGLLLYNSGNLTLDLTASAQVAYQNGYAQYSYQALTLFSYKASWLGQPVVIYSENISSPNTLSTVSYNLSLANIPEGQQQIIVTANEEGYISSALIGTPLNSVNYTSFSASTSAVFNFNVVTPAILVVSPAEGQVFNSSEIPLVLNANETPTWIGYSIYNLTKNGVDENPVEPCLSNLFVGRYGNTTLTGLTNGHYSLTIYGEDSFGNIGKSETVNFTINEPEVQPPEPKPTHTFPAATLIAVSVVVVAMAVVGIGLAVSFYRRRRQKTANLKQ